MKYGVYVIKDIKTGYLTPTIDINDASAQRNFEHAIMTEGTLYYTHADDYQLHKIGEYDSDTGVITQREENRYIIIEGNMVRLSTR